MARSKGAVGEGKEFMMGEGGKRKWIGEGEGGLVGEGRGGFRKGWEGGRRGPGILEEIWKKNNLNVQFDKQFNI